MSEATVIYGERLTVVQNASSDGDDLLLSPEDLARVSGWELTPEGVCLEGLCVPVPPGQESFNLSRLARLLDQPVVASPTHRVWYFGERPGGLTSRLASLIAPDFSLPDLDGRLYSLSQFRGRKVFLVTWASW